MSVGENTHPTCTHTHTHTHTPGIMTRMEKLEVWREKRKELMAKQKAENKQMPFVTGIFKPKTSGLKPPSSHTKVCK